MLFGTLQVLADLLPPSEAAAGVPIESLILPSVSAVGLPRGHPPRAVRAVARPGPAADRLPRVALALARGADPPRPGGADAGGPHVGPAHDPRRGLHRLHGHRGDRARAASPSRSASGATPKPIPEGSLLILAAGDAVIAFLLGYRAAALRMTSLRDGVWSALTYAAVVAIGAAAIRAMAIPRLLGPGAPDARVLPLGRASTARPGAPPRLRAGSGRSCCSPCSAIIVVAWNLLLRGVGAGAAPTPRSGAATFDRPGRLVLQSLACAAAAARALR